MQNIRSNKMSSTRQLSFKYAEIYSFFLFLLSQIQLTTQTQVIKQIYESIAYLTQFMTLNVSALLSLFYKITTKDFKVVSDKL